VRLVPSCRSAHSVEVTAIATSLCPGWITAIAGVGSLSSNLARLVGGISRALTAALGLLVAVVEPIDLLLLVSSLRQPHPYPLFLAIDAGAEHRPAVEDGLDVQPH